MDLSKYQDYLGRLVAWAADFTPKFVGAILALLIGFWLVQKLEQLLTHAMVRRGIDISLQSFLCSLLNAGLKVLLVVSVAGMLGFQTTSMVAVLGAAGLAVGLALQGSLANFAGGVLILMFKPFRIGDQVKIGDISGVVTEIQIFSTVLQTDDGKVAVLPNGAVSNGNIINSSRTGKLRVDITVKVDFEQDLEKVRAIILEVLEADNRILKSPAPSVTILNYHDDAMILAIRPYTKEVHYWPVYFDTHESVQKALLAHSIKPPASGPTIVNQMVAAGGL